MKRGIILIVFLLSISIVSAEELVVRYHSPSDPQTISLEEYLGKSSNYYVNYSEDKVTVVIDLKNRTATIISDKNYTGVITIKFSTEPLQEEAPKEKVPLKSLSMLPKGNYKTLEISPEELQRLMKYSITPDLQDQLKNVKKENIDFIYSEVKDNKLYVNINKEADFQIEFSEDKPIVNLDIKIPKVNATLVKTEIIKEKTVYDVRDYLIPILAIFLIILITMFLREGVRRIKERKPVSHEKIQKQDALRRLKQIESNPDKFLFERYIAIVRSFFSSYFKIENEFTYNELNQEIKNKVKDKSKQDFLLSLFSDISRLSYSQDKVKPSDVKDLIRRTKKAIRTL